MDCDAGITSLEFFTVKLVIISNWSWKSVFSSLHEFFLVHWYPHVFSGYTRQKEEHYIVC